MPLKTRAGSAEAPTEPGARTLWEPCETGPRLKPWRLIVPWKPLPIATPETLTRWPGSNCSTVAASPIFELLRAEVLVAELDQRAHRAGVGLLQVAELGLGELALLDLVEGELHGGVAVALGGADAR